ncbi:MAG: NHL repeat-containing protein, partial [Oscillospiraceae bacterium]
KKLARMLPLTLIVVFLLSTPVAALYEDRTYLYDAEEKSVHAPAPYEVEATYTGVDLEVEGFSNPSDLYVDSKQKIYIADSGNNRILIFDDNLKHLRTISEVMNGDSIEKLNAPGGVFVTGEGAVYICDTGNSRVIAVDENNKIVRLLDNKGFISVNKNFEYQPSKAVVDDVGNVYVVDTAVYQGIIQYDNADNFTGFFAPNAVPVTADVLFLKLWKSIFNSEQRANMEKVLPSPYKNIYIDKENFIYTSAVNVTEGNEIKRLNALGNNILRSSGLGSEQSAFGDLEISYDAGKKVTSRITDVHVSDSGIICAVDEARNRLFQYDQNGNLISIFGGKGNGQGNFLGIRAVDMIYDKYVVLDAVKENITIFKPTAYMNNVMQALEKYKQGLYLESVDQWNEVLKQNCNFRIAYRSIGRALLQQGQSKEAMKMLKRGDDKYFYSMALKEYRKEFVRNNFLILMIAVIIAITVLIKLIALLHRKLLKQDSGFAVKGR